MKFASCFVAAVLLATSSLVGAVPIGSQEIDDKSAQGLSLLRLGPDVDPVWKTEDEKWELKKSGVNFMDVTRTWAGIQSNPAPHKPSDKVSTTATFPTPSHQEDVNALIATLSTSNMESYLKSLTKFNNRYYNSSTGRDSAQWIFDKLNNITSESGKSGITVKKFTHPWLQFSVVARIDGTSPGPVTILGSHQDSINLDSPQFGRAPGADDDGSGTVNTMEIFRALVSCDKFKPTTPVEFHFYAGEEAGLLGSQEIASHYNKTGVKVKAFMELDMTAYFKPGTKEVIAVESDYVDSGTNKFAKSLIRTYSSLPAADDKPCGYACSDHASWYQYGYPTTMLFEAITGDDNPTIHSPNDTTSVEGFSWSHSLEFAKVALAFMYELSA